MALEDEKHKEERAAVNDFADHLIKKINKEERY